MPMERKHRTAFLDWYEPFLALAEKNNWRIFYVGGKQQSISRAQQWLAAHYPDLTVEFQSGFFPKESSELVFQRIRDFQPHVLLVGMGMPRQEDFILSAYEYVHTNAVVNGGAMIEYMIGEQVPTPRWIGQLGFEWLFRLATQPRRLAKRYLVEPLYLINALLRDFSAAVAGSTVPGRRNDFRERAQS